MLLARRCGLLRHQEIDHAESTKQPCRVSATPLADAVRRFTDETIIPNEPVLARGGDPAARKMRELMREARAAGLWGVFYPAELGGKITTLAEYLPVAEQEGRSEYGPAIFGSRATVDVHMLHWHASAAVRERFLAPLAAGEITGAYAVSEPDSIGSVPSTINAAATLANGTWLVSGRKWFVSRAKHAAFVTVVARTKKDSAQDHRFSMIVVPTETAGFCVEQEIEILGRPQGQCKLSFDQVAVPASHLLGQADQGLDLMRERLDLGRTLNAMHWLGLAQRCFDMMCERIGSQRGTLARLPESNWSGSTCSMSITQSSAPARTFAWPPATWIRRQMRKWKSTWPRWLPRAP
ncbi:acyl-CoA dehydrogenase family protein [Ralstonia syzygii]|uniref:acyl-CoA dehydrogenase family protein n=1 Tax=Ralstonia syzygii TaxID=28097 RepID=UPI0027DDC6F9|nr:acyl-CoA dehydrogenase family protein [Ralstonia syzygii]